MAEIIRGTNVSSPIVPGTVLDEYPTHDAKYGKGGFRSVATIEDRDAITAYRREVGMFVYVVATDKLYVYEVESDVGSWREWESGGGGGSNVSSYSESFNALADTPLTITHNLGIYPSITIKDSDGDIIVGEMTYTDENNIQLTFSEDINGTVYLI